MDNLDTAEFVSGLEGTEVTLDSPPELPLYLHPPLQTWLIEKQLSERSVCMTQQEVIDNLRLPYAAGKYLCHRKDNPSQKAFMRIYLQIPISGTQYQGSKTRGKQAAKPQPHIELTALRALQKLKCDVVPTLLSYREGQQDEDGIVPGGYITYVVWEKVPGEPLSPEEFWELDLESRQAIRDTFREAFP